VEGWYEIPDSIVQDGSPVFTFFTRMYFVCILFTGGVIGLSLVNSIFVDTMVSDNTADLEKQVASLQEKIDLLLARSAHRE
jgi:voltage-gated sodium channel